MANTKMEFIPIDLTIHLETIVDLSLKYNQLMVDSTKSQFHIDWSNPWLQKEFIKNMVKKFAPLWKPPLGIYYLLKEQDKFIGMGAIHKLMDDIGEFKRIYILPQYRGKGYGKSLVKRLIQKGIEFGFKTIYLETPSFFKTAHNLYSSEGFHERKPYYEWESFQIPDYKWEKYKVLQKYWIYMEKDI